jgi:hypothetical protein
MTLKATVTYKGFIPKMPKRAVNATLRESYRDVGYHFFDKNLPRRFTVGGGRTLGYDRRSPRYQNRKRSLFGHTLPLVFSGKTRSRALSKSFTEIIAKATKGIGSLVLSVNVPALNFKHPKGPNTREEFERVSPREIGPLERVLEISASNRFESYNETSNFKA